jgi:hypothetical protein
LIGESYEGDFVENLFHGQGTYIYKNGDIYDGIWANNKKNGAGTYEYAADFSVLKGDWENGFMKSGKWLMKNAATYEGDFKYGVPVGAGKFVFQSGLVLPGVFEEKGSDVDAPAAIEEDETPADDDGEVLATPLINTEPPVVTWRGDTIVSF